MLHAAFDCAERPDVIPCTAECRNAKLEAALGPGDEPPDEFSRELIEFALQNVPFIQKLEAKLLDVLARKTRVTFLPSMSRTQRKATHDLVNNHYNMETISYDSAPNRSIAIYWK